MQMVKGIFYPNFAVLKQEAPFEIDFQKMAPGLTAMQEKPFYR